MPVEPRFYTLIISVTALRRSEPRGLLGILEFDYNRDLSAIGTMYLDVVPYHAGVNSSLAGPSLHEPSYLLGN